MAAGNFLVYVAAKKFLMSGGIDLDSDVFKMSLWGSASNAADMSLSVISQVVGEAIGLGYSAKPLTGVTWTQGVSAGQQKFNAAPVVFGSPINAIKFAVISKVGSSAGASRLLCCSQLSTSQFNVATGVTFGVTPAPTGIFTLA
jgi:hypothetical protein